MHCSSIIFVAVLFVGGTIAWTVGPTESTAPPTPAPTTANPTGTTIPPWLRCDVNGEYFPDTTNCQAFYECINNVKQHMICPDPLLWNVHLPGCTESSDCSQIETSTTPASCTNGDMKADVNSCHYFYICESNQWEGPIQCPVELYWSASKRGCVKIEDSDCPGHTTVGYH
ncbi:probable chitinase 10 isoform X7 [Diabrotica virgifera virgifera]|uniref:Chitin-binding type-2 domain-containing protein n=1 Tax=Diabrotica virgifera virgifera TaxID=50390 RepID=A0ABM5K4J6_DIAVI|nr:probable chitinase 10 isoform X5 [Diabrotica virgifera virgifera]XP_050505109.1 probable chitinase 10 isoform X6 [Diabrotica virgifera virgifera]XP_050505110.1 probable chitinase 10 isoform X7 [Diabrotica virgifera virgifera]